MLFNAARIVPSFAPLNISQFRISAPYWCSMNGLDVHFSLPFFC